MEIVSPDGELHQRIKRNQAGTFYQLYQHNKWAARLKREAEEAAAAAAGGGAGSLPVQQQDAAAVR